LAPDEDQDYFLLNVQRPDAASLQRTDLVCRRVEKILSQTKGVRSYSTLSRFSLLAYVSATYNGFFFVSLEPWEARRTKGMDAKGLIAKLNGRFKSEIPEANVFAFLPPP